MRIAGLLAALLLATSAFAGAAETIVLDIRNMTCSLCAVTVRKSLERVPGVSEAKVDYDRKTATVSYDPAKAAKGELVKATTDAGFPSSVRR